CAVRVPVSVGSSAERAWRTTWCSASASRWLTLTRGLLVSAIRSASSRVRRGPGAAMGRGATGVWLAEDDACEGGAVVCAWPSNATEKVSNAKQEIAIVLKRIV